MLNLQEQNLDLKKHLEEQNKKIVYLEGTLKTYKDNIEVLQVHVKAPYQKEQEEFLKKRTEVIQEIQATVRKIIFS